MTSYIHIQWSCSSIDLARTLSRQLVEKKLVACAQIIPWVESIYIWDGQLHTEQETQISMKSREQLFPAIEAFLSEHSEYETPQILKLPILDANAAYLSWIDEMTQA